MPQDVTTLFLNYSRDKLIGQYLPRLRSVLEPISDEQAWWRLNDASNSIGNLLLHLNGNVKQWLVASFNHQDDNRNRPEEFDAPRLLPLSELLGNLEATLVQASQVLERLTAEELTASYEIQGYRVTGLDAVYQVVSHFGLHYGQILYIVKMLTATDLQLTPHLNAAGHFDASTTHP